MPLPRCPLLARPLPPHLSVSVMRAIGQANQHVDWRGPERERAPTQKEEPKRGRGSLRRRRPTFIPSLGTRSVRPARTATRSRGGAPETAVEMDSTIPHP